MSLGDGQLVGSYVHLPNKPREQHALYLLRKVASLVKPIMLQRNFRVRTLAEFYPNQPNLLGLNVNGGEKIFLRLRQPYDDSSFVPEEDLVFVMLHELTHNVRGPHDEVFNRVLGELETDYYALRRKGYSGEGFYSPGHRLGAGRPQNPSLSDARRRAVQAADRRRVLTRGSGQKLGGTTGSPSPLRGLRNRLAEAVERRLRDSKGCGGGYSRERGAIEADAEQAIRNGFRTRAEEDDANERAIVQAAVELMEEAEKEEHAERVNRQESGGYVWLDEDGPSSSSGRRGSRSASPRPDRTRSGNGATSRDDAGLMWECSICTLRNPALYLQCDACGAEKPVFASAPPAVPYGSRPNPTVPRTPGPLTPSSSSSTNSSSSATAARKPSFLDTSSQANLARVGPPPKAPPSWFCHRCTMENAAQWWTCQACGVMKLAS